MASIINATTTNGVAISADNSGILQLATNSGTTAVTIDASQNVGIGTASPVYRLQVQSPSAIMAQFNGNNANNYLQLSDNNGTNNCSFGSIAGGNWYMYTSGYGAFYTGGTERMRIASNGIVTMSAYGAGAATFSAAGVISSVSDETWKIKDGVPTNPDDMLQKLMPGYWFYNDEKKEIFGKDRQLGFYAQNVNQAIGVEAAPIPETYTELDENNTEVIKTKPWGYYDRSVLAVAVMSLQKALTTIEELKLTIDTQQTQITALNAKVGI